MVQVLVNKLISMNGFLVIPTLCTRWLQGFCWLFLPNLFNKHEIVILQKEKKERKCISFCEEWILQAERCENTCSREKIILPWKQLSQILMIY